MALAFISLGSNIVPRLNLSRALARIERHYGPLRRSTVYQSEAVGFEGPPFLNMVVTAEADEPPLGTWRFLRSLEQALGRRRQGPKLTSRPIDLDLLLVGNLVIDKPPLRLPHSDITRYSFVIRPLAELAADMRHPTDGRTMVALAAELDLEPRELTEVALEQTDLTELESPPQEAAEKPARKRRQLATAPRR